MLEFYIVYIKKSFAWDTYKVSVNVNIYIRRIALKKQQPKMFQNCAYF